MSSPLSDEVAAHYSGGYEATRVTREGGTLEMVRTQELVRRYLPPAPAVLYDIGGGPGVYALWLARLGYEVQLLDALPLHVNLAREASALQPDAPLAGVSLGDARRLDWPDQSADAVLLFGPLYHLTERDDRVVALREARRVLRLGGVVLGVGISRFASLIDGVALAFLADSIGFETIRRDLATGQHRNPSNNPQWFTTAYFHLPAELNDEVEAAGLCAETTLAVEGPVWRLAGFAERWDDPAWRERILETIHLVEREPSLLGASAHIMVVARKA
jgi:ubiquinone/menaquinone biosynthesis C-methylase UbiE